MTRIIEVDVQEDVMKLDTVSANLYILARFIECPFEKFLAWAYAIDLFSECR